MRLGKPVVWLLRYIRYLHDAIQFTSADNLQASHKISSSHLVRDNHNGIVHPNQVKSFVHPAS